MKITLTYNMPDDTEEYDAAINGPSYLKALQDFDNELRSIVKHGREGYDPDAADKIRELFWETLGKCEVELW